MEKLISVEELQEKLNKQEKVFILDVRPLDQRIEWRIDGSAHVDAYQQLKYGDDTALDLIEIPYDRTVVTVCAAGKTSLLAANLLQRKGINAYSLEGGMKAWNYAWNTATIRSGTSLTIIQVRRTAKGCLSYIAASGGEAIVIDAALDPDVYIGIAKQNGWSIKYVTDTHIHADYISRTRDLAGASGAKHVLINKATVDFEFFPVRDGDLLPLGDYSVQVIHTPGHTLESTSFEINGSVIFTGDTLFADGVGRPDLKANHEEAIEKSKMLFQSLQGLMELPSSLLVLPAHTSKTVPFDSKPIASTIGEIQKNSLLTMGEQKFVEYTTTRIPPTPPNYVTIATLNKQGSYKGYKPAELEAGGNHCAIG
jgi:glyoxylase-like metal-dependent hydrolase (beta-lactamase superfamily II)/rhodanese-related sulfurtransferase